MLIYFQKQIDIERILNQYQICFEDQPILAFACSSGLHFNQLQTFYLLQSLDGNRFDLEGKMSAAMQNRTNYYRDKG